MTPASATFLLALLNMQTLQVSAPDFDATVQKIQKARAELLAIAESEPD